jgi:hypothetical protein
VPIVPYKDRAEYNQWVKKIQITLYAVIVSVLVTGCGVKSPLSNNSEKAQQLVKRACGDSSKPALSWQARTNLAAEAHALDKSWNKFYEATSSLTAIENISKDKSSWERAPGNDGVQIAYINAKSYSVYVAECYRMLVSD